MSTSLFLAEEPTSCLTLRFQGTRLAKGDHGWPVFHFSNWPCLSASCSLAGSAVSFLAFYAVMNRMAFLFFFPITSCEKAAEAPRDMLTFSFFLSVLLWFVVGVGKIFGPLEELF